MSLRYLLTLRSTNEPLIHCAYVLVRRSSRERLWLNQTVFLVLLVLCRYPYSRASVTSSEDGGEVRFSKKFEGSYRQKEWMHGAMGADVAVDAVQV